MFSCIFVLVYLGLKYQILSFLKKFLVFKTLLIKLIYSYQGRKNLTKNANKIFSDNWITENLTLVSKIIFKIALIKG